jgi:hypothetical protein
MPALKVWNGTSWVEAGGVGGVSTATAPLVVAGANMSIPAATPVAPGHMTAAQAGLVGLLSVPQAGAAALNAPIASAFVTSKQGAYLTYNASFDGTNWLRYDTSAFAQLFVVAGNGILMMYTAPAGANPITWTASTIATGPDSGWLNLGSYGTSWSSYGPPFLAQYRKLPSGMVICRGLVTKSAALGPAGEIIATFPAGFRPAAGAQLIFGATNYGLVGTDLRLDSNGSLMLQSGGHAGWTSLTSVTFLAE